MPINTRIDFKLEYDYYDRDIRDTRQLSYTILDALNGSLSKGDGVDFSVYDYMDFNYEIFTDRPDTFCGKQTEIDRTAEAEIHCCLKFQWCDAH